MTDWNTPVNGTTYSSVLSLINEKAATLAKEDYGSDTNIPTGAVRFNATTKARERWSGSAWAEIAGAERALQAVFTTAGTQPTYTATPTIAWVGYVAGDVITISPHATNTGSATLNVSGQGAKTIKYKGRNLGGGELNSGVKAVLYYDGTDFILLNHGDGWLNWTPTVAGSGSMTISASSVSGLYRQDGKIVDVIQSVTSITTAGTASTGITLTAPISGFLTTLRIPGYGFDTADFAGYVRINGGGTLLECVKADLSNWGIGAGRSFVFQGRYLLN
jgi:hypothetical protein